MRDETDLERRHALALISAQAMRVYEMIADMMLFARPPRPELQPVELVSLVDTVVADVLPRCAQHETAICRTGDSGAILVDADPVQLNVALRAICQNSLEALGSGGNIEIAVENRGSEAQVQIRDNGPGIKSEERQHTFDPFYSARQAGRGLGLGLCKAWRIIGNHAGRIDIDSQPGQGTAVTVFLPIRASQAAGPRE